MFLKRILPHEAPVPGFIQTLLDSSGNLNTRRRPRRLLAHPQSHPRRHLIKWSISSSIPVGIKNSCGI